LTSKTDIANPNLLIKNISSTLAGVNLISLFLELIFVLLASGFMEVLQLDKSIEPKRIEIAKIMFLGDFLIFLKRF
tara:strand:- start:153 stop:380 length:228 start_codon:yes stop_codon:yes gene_type:complete